MKSWKSRITSRIIILAIVKKKIIIIYKETLIRIHRVIEFYCLHTKRERESLLKVDPTLLHSIV